MSGLLSGLSSLGLGALEKADIFAKEEKEERTVEELRIKKPLEVSEQDLIYDKTIMCPLCEHKFLHKTVKAGKTPLIDTDQDLRPRYENIDIMKYDVVLCPRCGYAALTRYFKPLPPVLEREVQNKISMNFKYQPLVGDTISYDEAIERYKLALANAIVKRAKASEKAYICLKAGWTCRGAAENLDPNADDYEEKKASYEQVEEEFMENAYEGFISARQNENYPMCGMDEITVAYLIAVLAIRFEKLDVASKLVSNILVSPNANKRMKEKTLELKEIIIRQIKEKSGK